MAITDEQYLRSLLGESIPEGGTAASTFFTDEQITDLLGRSSDDFNKATLLGWTMKMADFAKYINMEESGAKRALRDKFRNAQEMVKQYTAVVDSGDVALTTGDTAVPATVPLGQWTAGRAKPAPPITPENFSAWDGETVLPAYWPT